jgi:hypothetical protein
MNIIFDLLKNILSAFIKAKKEKNHIILTTMYIGFILVVVAFLLGITGDYFIPKKGDSLLLRTEHLLLSKRIYYTAIILLFISFILLLIPTYYYEILKIETTEKLINEQEKKVAENPHEPKLAWDLARSKLENYLDRNLTQLRSIFYLSAFASTMGFGLIIYGSIMVFQKESNLQASIVVAISGLVSNFIAATFLTSYKSTMEQAKDYVNVLERINAVGMSVQIIESINDSHLQIKEETKAELSKKLIDLYSEKK